MLPNTVAVLSLGLLVDALGFSHHWTPKKKPCLEKGKVKVACHPSNNVPFIYPSAASDDRALWEEAGEQEDDDTIKVSEVYKQWKDAKTSPPVAVREDELDEGDVPRVRCRP